MNLNLNKLREEFGNEKVAQWLKYQMQFPANFWYFTNLFPETFNKKTPEFHKKIIRDVTNNYQYPFRGKFAKAAPRGGAKSSLITKLVLWYALYSHFRFIPYISDTFNQAKLHVGTIKADIEENESLKYFFPNAMGEKWGEEGILINGINGKDCLIMPLGASMKIRGLKFKNYRPQLLVFDDLENSEMVYSEERRKKLKHWFDYEAIPALDPNNKNAIIIGTILHHNSLLNDIINNYEGWDREIIKGLQENETKSYWEDLYPVKLLKEIRDNPKNKDYIGSRVFSQEIQNEPQDDKDRIIKLDWIKYYNFNEERNKIEADDDKKRLEKLLLKYKRFGGCDPAQSEKEQADYMCIYAYGVNKESGKEDMLDFKRFKNEDPLTQIKEICDTIQNWKLEVFGIETNNYKGLSHMIRSELNKRNIFSCRVVPIRTDKDKVRRAKIHSISFEAGLIRFRSDHPLTKVLVNEILEFPLGKHDDGLDSLMLGREARKRKGGRMFAKKPLGL